MKLTFHAAERILDRTKLNPKDVLSIVAEGATIVIGHTVDGTYHLFYSPPDRRCKVAIVLGDKHLISVWETDFAFPAGIRHIDAGLELQAKKALKRLLWSRIPTSEPRILTATARLYVNETFDCARSCGEVSPDRARNLETILLDVRPELSKFVLEIDETKKGTQERIRYRINIVDPTGVLKPFSTTYVRHQTLMKRFFPAT